MQKRQREPMTQTVKASEARKEWSQLLHKVYQGDTRLIVEKSGIPVAAIISTEDLERLTYLERQRKEKFKALEATWEAFKDVPDEELEREIDRSINDVRQATRKSEKGKREQSRRQAEQTVSKL